MRDFVKKINPKFYILFSGILLGVSVVFAEMGILSYLALIPLFLVVISKIESEEYQVKSAYFEGLLFFFSFYLVAFHWLLYFYPLDFTGLGRIEALGIVLLGWIGIPLIQSVFSALIFVAILKLSKTEVCKKCPVLMPFFTGALFVVNEWSQTFTWAGVPWGRISITHTQMPILMQGASIFGGYILTFIVVTVNFLLAQAIYKKEFRHLAMLTAIVVFCTNFLFSSVLYFIPTHNESRAVKIAAVQGNLPSQEDRGFFSDGVFEKYAEITREAVRNGAEIVVWPEGAFITDVDGLIKGEGDRYISLKKAVVELSCELGISIVFGSYYVDENENYYNAMNVFYPDGTFILGACCKEKLVPFGEFVPMRDIIEFVLPQLALINTMPDDLTSVREQKVFDSSKNGVKIGAMICFDAIFEATAIDSSRAGAEVFIIPSDDSWFYESRALNMHHSQNILRAVEQGKYTVNCANTGLTSILSNKGEIVEQMPIFTEGYVVETVYASEGRTLYSYIGNLFVYLCIVVVVFPLSLEAISKKRA